MKSLAIVILVLYLLQTGTAIKCYQCSSKSSTEKGFDIECSMGTTRQGMGTNCLTYDKKPGFYCAKAIGYVGQEWLIMRGCVREGDGRGSRFEFNGQTFTNGRLFTCKTDLCNSSLLTAPNIFFLVIIPILNLLITFI